MFGEELWAGKRLSRMRAEPDSVFEPYPARCHCQVKGKLCGYAWTWLWVELLCDRFGSTAGLKQAPFGFPKGVRGWSKLPVDGSLGFGRDIGGLTKSPSQN